MQDTNDKYQPEESLNAYKAKMDLSASLIDQIEGEIERIYKSSGQCRDLKNEFLEFLNEIVRQSKTESNSKNTLKKSLIHVVDPQRDFLLPGMGLCTKEVTSRIKVILHNMAFFDAFKELNDLDRSYFDISTSKDVHEYNRDESSDDYKKIRDLSSCDGMEALVVERTELSSFDPNNARFDAHCVKGYAGVEFQAPLKQRFDDLNVNDHFMKINFDVTRSSFLIDKNAILSGPNTSKNIIDKKICTFNNFLTANNYSRVIVAGTIAGEVCVEQALLGIKKILPNAVVYLIDACTQYLQDSEKEPSQQKCKNHGIIIQESRYVKSNVDTDIPEITALVNKYYEDNTTNEIPVHNTIPLQFFLNHPKACVALIELIAFGAVAGTLIATLGTATLAANVTIVAPVAGVALAAAAIGLFFVQRAKQDGKMPQNIKMHEEKNTSYS